jgi:DNA-binding CsgD family transcriptional regulator
MSQREAEVLEALGAHLSNAQIAGRLHISVRTVESHVSSLLRKFGVADRRELAELAQAVLAPAARPPAAPRGLPALWTSFVGRDYERDAIVAALKTSRLVSLIGPGGVGKTRLAVEVAREATFSFPSGCAFIDLVPVTGEFVTQAVAALLEVTEEPGQLLDKAVLDHLASGRWLLVFDNCEHLLAVVAAFAERILAACPGVTVLVTSQERLAVPGEHAVPVRARRPRRCSSTEPGPWRRTLRLNSQPLRNCAHAWTGCRWPSSWPQLAARRWGWLGCGQAWMIGCAW